MQITVNGEKIEAAAIERERENVRSEHGDWTDAQVNERTRDSVAEWALIRQEADRFTPEPTADEIEAEFKKLTDSQGGKAEFFRRYNLTGRDEQRIRQDLTRQLRTTRFLGDLSHNVPAPADAAIFAGMIAQQAQQDVPAGLLRQAQAAGHKLT